MKEIKEER